MDHIAGASELLKFCANAKLYISSALTGREALQMASLYKRDVFADTDKDIREFGEIIQFLHKTKDRDRLAPVKARHIFFDYRRETIPVRLVALSPSNVAVTQSISKLCQSKKSPGDPRIRNVVPVSENNYAVALHFSFGDFSVLLGSDLEETNNSQAGWSAIFEDNITSELSLPAASLYKVAHHGSDTAHHEKIWEYLLHSKPLSITTPFTRSSLPTEENIKRLEKLSKNLLITRDPRAHKKIGYDNMVERELRAIVKKRKSINAKMGHIQIRVSANGKLRVGTNNNAVAYSGTDL